MFPQSECVPARIESGKGHFRFCLPFLCIFQWIAITFLRDNFVDLDCLGLGNVFSVSHRLYPFQNSLNEFGLNKFGKEDFSNSKFYNMIVIPLPVWFCLWCLLKNIQEDM